jgi:hypothetical protein
LVVDSNHRHFKKTTPAMNNPMLPLPGLSPVSGKAIVAKFDGGLLSSDGGIVVLREVERPLTRFPRVSAMRGTPSAPMEKWRGKIALLEQRMGHAINGPSSVRRTAREVRALTRFLPTR